MCDGVTASPPEGFAKAECISKSARMTVGMREVLVSMATLNVWIKKSTVHFLFLSI